MGTDTLRVESNERVDLVDFEHAVDTSIQANHRQWGAEMFTDPAKGRQFILDGFTIDNPTGDQIRVTLGRAILGQREGGQVFQGHLVSEGEVSRIADVNGFADATYGIFVRFEYVDGTNQGRAFWNPQGNGSEFAQTIATRRIANWSMRVEIATPGAEWLQIGQVIVSGGSISVAAGGLVDLRTFFFEGQRNADIPPATPADNGTQFQSGWSTDGGGAALDRNADRELNGVKDLQTFTAAMRQCIEDIKGRGLKRWWDRDIGGMNIGFDANPVSGRLAIGDANFYTEIASSNPTIVFETVGPTFLEYDRSGERFVFERGGTEELVIGTAGGSRGVRTAAGLAVGHSAQPPLSSISIGSNDFVITSVGGPQIRFDDSDTDRLLFDGLQTFLFQIASTTITSLSPSGVNVGTGTFGLRISGANNILDFDASDQILYNTTLNNMAFVIGNIEEVRLSATGLAVANGLRVGGSVATAPDDDAIVLDDRTTDPATAGAIFRRDQNGWLCHAETASEFRYISSMVYSNADINESLVNPTSETAFTTFFTIPGGTMRVGTFLKVLVHVTGTSGLGQNITVNVYLGDQTNPGGSSNVSQLFFANGGDGFQGEQIVTMEQVSIGVTGSIQGRNKHMSVNTNSSSLNLIRIDGSGAVENWNSDVDVFVTARCPSGGVTFTLDTLVVEIH